MSKSLKQHIDDAAMACSDLNIFYGVIALLEGGTINAASDRNAQRIIAICKTSAQECLKRMDRAVLAAILEKR